MNMQQYKSLLDTRLEEVFSELTLPQHVILESARYSLLNGGKRLRGAFLLEFCRICGGNIEDAMPFAKAIEMIHAYSLVHDDLPCMDNDDMRRGKPTNHKVYGEGMAVLTGDALLNGAYEIMLKEGLNGEKYVKAALTIAQCAGIYGMIGGQVLDVKEGVKTPHELTHMVNLKTGKLFEAACMAGAILGGANEEMLKNTGVYAEKIGLSFQIRDDILDEIGDVEKLGKLTKSDDKLDKYTFVKAFGLEKCEQMVDEMTQEAICAAKTFKDNDCLMNIAEDLRKRDL